MPTGIFAERERALENEFFYKVDQELCRKLREQMQAEKARDALFAETGFKNSDVIDELVAIGIRCETLLALSMVPLIKVAWADGGVDSRERDAILQAAEAIGHSKDNASYHLLEVWLQHTPGEAIYTAWRDYVVAVSETLSLEHRNALRDEIVGRARTVAEAAGGFLGFGKISRAEEEMLHELERAFSIFWFPSSGLGTHVLDALRRVGSRSCCT